MHRTVVFEAINQAFPARPERGRLGSIRADDANLAVPLQRDASRLGLADRFSLEDVLDRHLDVSLANGPDGDRGGGSLGEGVGWQDIGSTQGGSSTVWQLRDVNWVS